MGLFKMSFLDIERGREFSGHNNKNKISLSFNSAANFIWYLLGLAANFSLSFYANLFASDLRYLLTYCSKHTEEYLHMIFLLILIKR